MGKKLKDLKSKIVGTGLQELLRHNYGNQVYTLVETAIWFDTDVNQVRDSIEEQLHNEKLS